MPGVDGPVEVDGALPKPSRTTAPEARPERLQLDGAERLQLEGLEPPRQEQR